MDEIVSQAVLVRQVMGLPEKEEDFADDTSKFSHHFTCWQMKYISQKSLNLSSVCVKMINVLLGYGSHTICTFKDSLD